MRLRVIGTGSSGNAYLLQSEGDGSPSLLLDAGLSSKRILRGLGSRNIASLCGCLITHEHGDHALCARWLAQNGIDVYATAGTIKAANLDGLNRVHSVKMYEPFQLGDFTVMAFPTEHDAAEPCGFLVDNVVQNVEKLIYATDTFYLRHTFPGIHYWLVECNYIDELLDRMIDDGSISKTMRHRLLTSHMSLRRLKDALAANDLRDTRKIVLCHLSDVRSDEAKMVAEIREFTGLPTVAADAGMDIELDLCPF